MIFPVYIIGVGPGALDLLTIRAAKKIKEAEVILWTDSLISKEIIELAPQSCEIIKTSSLTLEEIITLMVERVRSQKKVIRLHDGDPCLYSTLSEQIYKLSKEGIEVEVIPGISAYQALAATIKTELTIPGEIQTIIISRSEGRTSIPNKEKLESLAKLGSSLCLYLSARHVEEIEKTLLRHYPAETSVAIGFRVGWHNEERIKIVPLNQMASTSKKMGLIRSTLYLISPAIGKSSKRSKLYASEHNHLFRQKGQ